MVNLLQGNCLDVMKDIPDGSVDMVLTDPPYNISKKNGFKSMGRAGIDFGEWDKEADLFSYMDKCAEILKAGGSFIIFNDWRNLGDIERHAVSLGLESKDMLRIEKTNPMPRNTNRRYVSDYECAVWFVKPKAKWVFNKLKDTYMRPKFMAPVSRGGLHPTQKDLKVMTDLVKIHSNKGDVVLDPFMGSGTTGVACMNTGRNFIGIELDDGYFEIAEGRIAEALGNKALSKPSSKQLNTKRGVSND